MHRPTVYKKDGPKSRIWIGVFDTIIQILGAAVAHRLTQLELLRDRNLHIINNV